MSFERHETLPKFLSSLSQIALEHTQATGLPAHFEFSVVSGEAGAVAFYEPDGSAVHTTEAEPPVAPSPEVDFVLTEARATKEAMDDGAYAVQSSVDGTVTATFIPGAIASDEPAANPGDLSAVAKAPTHALTLLAALKKHGHTSGYGAIEIDKAAEKLGVTFSPEVRFYRANAKNGKVADGPHGDVVDSALDADFGASVGNDPLPVPRPSDVVQPLRSNKLWIEIAHDDAAHYAADLAPGASGAIGQIIGRENESTNPPQLVARSLIDFVNGEWVDEETAAASWTPSVAVTAEPSTWSLSADDFEGMPRFIQLAEEEPEVAPAEEPAVEEVATEEPVAVETPAVEETSEQDVVAEVPEAETPEVEAPEADTAELEAPQAEATEPEAVEEDTADEDYDPITSMMTGSDISFGEVIAADDLGPIAEAPVVEEPADEPAQPVIEEKPEEVLVSQTSVEPAPIVPIEEVEEPAQMPVHPIAEPEPAPVEPKTEAPQAAEPQAEQSAEAKPKVPRKAKKRAQRVSFEVSSSDFSAEPSAMTDDFIALAPVIDTNDIKGFKEDGVENQSSPISPDGGDLADLPDSIFEVNKINRQGRSGPKKPSERSSQDIAQDFAAVAFGNPYEEDDEEDYYDNRREGGLRKAFRRFFG